MRKQLLAALAALTLGSGLAMIASAPAQAVEMTDSKPEITAFSASPATFYPTVRDGFRDGVTFDGASSEIITDEAGNTAEQKWTVTVRNSRGTKVAEASAGLPEYDNLWWRWSGKNQRTGDPVPVGTYTAKLVVTNTDTNETDTATRTLYAKSDIVNRRHTIADVGGIHTYSRSKSSSCYINRDYGTDHLNLDCWGGRQATATYGFGMRAGAFNIDWSVRGTRGCCDDGRVTKTGTRDGRSFDIRVRVTGWASYTVKGVTLAYTYRVRR